MSDSAVTEPEGLPRRTLSLYALPAVGIGYGYVLVTLYLMKYATDVLLIPPAAMGAIFMAGRIWDAVTDPLAGYWSDRTRLRMGRRRPWMLGASLPAAITFWMLWAPPAGFSEEARIAWMSVAVLAFYTAMTGFAVPHSSLGAELTTSYHDRTRVFGARQLAWYAGVFLALASMFALTRRADPRDLAGSLGWIAGIGMVALIAIAVRGLRERSDFLGRGAGHPYRAFRDVWRNPHARLLLFVFLVESTGGATVGVLTIYLSEYVLQTPALTTVYIGAYFAAATISIPLWTLLSKRVGKSRLWLAAMVVTAAGFGAVFFLGPGDAVPLIGIAVILGLAAGCGNVVGPSIQADVIDWDEWSTGERKEGAYFSAWTFVFKLATGLTLGLTGLVLQATGFVPNAAQTEEARLAIRMLYSFFPLACYGVGAALFVRFSFDEAEYARVRREIDARGAGGR